MEADGTPIFRSMSQNSFFGQPKKDSARQLDTDDIQSRIDALEERLKACDSFFQVTLQGIQMEERQRKSLQKILHRSVDDLILNVQSVQTEITTIDERVKKQAMQKLKEHWNSQVELSKTKSKSLISSLSVIDTNFSHMSERMNSTITELINSKTDQNRLLTEIERMECDQHELEALIRDFADFQTTGEVY